MGIPHSTSAFRLWFGDSKMVDANGKPLVVYHGTTADFNAFRIIGAGAHFGTLDQAQSRSPRGQVMPVFLAVRNPLRVRDLNTFGPRSLGAHLRGQGVISDAEMNDVDSAGSRSRAWPVLRDILEVRGYDGLVYLNEQEGSVRDDSFMIFRPEQIKSAIGNNGDFDSTNPDICF